MWIVLGVFHLIIRLLMLIPAAMLGNALIASHIARLSDNATWLSKAMVWVLTFPDKVGSWVISLFAPTAVGDLESSGYGMSFVSLWLFRVAPRDHPTLFLGILLLAGVLINVILMMVSPLQKRVITYRIADTQGISMLAAREWRRQNRRGYMALRREMFFRDFLGVPYFFIISLAAAGYAWVAVVLIGLNVGWFLQVLIVIGLLIILAIGAAIRSALENAFEQA